MNMRQKINALRLQPIDTLDESSLLKLLAIRNQKVVRENSHQSHFISEPEHFAWVADIKKDPKQCFLAVLEGQEIIGGAGLRHMDTNKSSADWSFYLSEARHGKGLGIALCILALDHFFGEYQLAEITGETVAHNRVSQKLHSKLGFEKVKQSASGDKDNAIIVYKLSNSVWRDRRAALVSD